MTLTEFIAMVILSALVGVVGEALARRHAPMGCMGATILGFLAIFLVNSVFHFHIIGEPSLDGVPLITSILAAAILVALWSAFAYHRVYGYYRRGGYAHRPRRRWW